MPASLSSITSKRATLMIPLDKNDPDSERVRVVYKPKALTPRVFDEMNEATRNKVTGEVIEHSQLVRFIMALVVEWDLRFDPSDPEPISLTPEGLIDVPVSVLNGVVMDVINDQNPDPKAESGLPKHS